MVQTDLREIALLDRRGTNSAKWDSLLATFGQEDLLPLWVADMDFKAPKCVRDALHQAVEQRAFGYYRVPDAYYESILGWEKTQHGTCLQREWIRTTSGVVSGLFQLIQAITAPGDGILVQIPVYYPFYRVIRNTGRRAVYHPLTERNGIYTVDLEQFEQTIVAQSSFCSVLLTTRLDGFGGRRSSEACWRAASVIRSRWCQMKSTMTFSCRAIAIVPPPVCGRGKENPLPFSLPAKPLIWLV